MSRPIMKLCAGVLVLVALIAPATAAAEPFTPELEADYTAALAWWGVSSPSQCASVTREIVPGYPEGTSEALADATQPFPGETDAECVLQFFGIPSYTLEAYGRTCVTEVIIRHEVGHLLGHSHSADPQSIMFPVVNYSDWCPAINSELIAAANAWELAGRLEAARRALRKVERHCLARHTWRSRSRRRHCAKGIAYWQTEIRRARMAAAMTSTYDMP